MANIIAGIVLTYTRAFQIGDQVEIADTRGRIVERTTFVTRIQTLKNVIVSIPNSMVLNNNIINYSKNMGQSGLLVHTSITIGYDVPWQTVNQLLVAAAQKTEASRGTMMRLMPSSRAIIAAWIAPAPPAQISGHSRGSWPRSTEISRIADAMLTFITRYIPAAAATTSSPSGSAMSRSTAARAASTSSFIRPPAKKSAER